MALIFVRHTTPDIAQGICYGQTDLDVAASFTQEAEAVLQAMPKIERIVTSPLLRCRKLADFLADHHGLEPKTDPRLMEMDFGSWEGMAWADISRQELDAWANNFLHARPHGGESVAMLRDRTLDVLDALKAANKPTLIVTHAGVIKAAFATGDTADDFKTKVAFGGILSFEQTALQIMT